MRRHPAIQLRQARGMEPDRLSACVDRSTRIIAASYVSYLTGERVDLAALRALADKVGALLLVDFTQAPATCRSRPLSPIFAFSACYKWMLGITGARWLAGTAHANRIGAPRFGWLALVRARLTRLRHDPGIEGGCDAVYPGQSGALSDLCTEQRIVVSFPV